MERRGVDDEVVDLGKGANKENTAFPYFESCSAKHALNTALPQCGQRQRTLFQKYKHTPAHINAPPDTELLSVSSLV